jgi:hypothetical protein
MTFLDFYVPGMAITLSLFLLFIVASWTWAQIDETEAFNTYPIALNLKLNLPKPVLTETGEWGLFLYQFDLSRPDLTQRSEFSRLAAETAHLPTKKRIEHIKQKMNLQ